MRPITLAGFDRKFAGDEDPWSTFTDRDEALKRHAILRAMGPGPLGRVLELAAGNGSNSASIAPRVLRLDATEATATGVALVARALSGQRRARALQLIVPDRLPRERYDIVIVAEVIYYLSARDMKRTARDVVAALRPGGTLVLAHHRVDYPDFAQHAANLQHAFLRATGRDWTVRVTRRTQRWTVLRCRLRGRPFYRTGGCVARSRETLHDLHLAEAPTGVGARDAPPQVLQQSLSPRSRVRERDARDQRV